ncbi:MAG: protoporphyrinogen oxidase [Lysobacterales bacterium]
MKAGIVGAGISGLATGQAILAKDPGAEVVVFESSGRVGGKVISERTDEGYLCEWGVNGFLDKVPRTLELCDEVGVQPLPADASAKRRYVFSEGALHKLPEKPPEFLSSKLLSMAGRLRVIGEIFTGASGTDDETLAEFGVRHLGREAFEKLIDPMASGVFAGDARKMSLKSCFPRIHEVESEYGSLIRGLIKLQKEARRAGAKKTPGPGPGGILTSFAGGMSVLTDTLAAELGSRVRLNAPVAGVSFEGGVYGVHLADGSSESFDRLVVAVPAYVQARILRDLSPAIAGLVAEIPYPSLAVVCTGYQAERMERVPDGFGFLVPSRERRSILGTVFDSNVFPGRAPDGGVLLRSMVGGARDSESANLPEGELLDTVLGEHRDILRLNVDPDFARVYRHERAIPQYLVGHAARLESIERELARLPGLVLGGNAFRGVSLNDCVLNAGRTAEKLLRGDIGQ